MSFELEYLDPDGSNTDASDRRSDESGAKSVPPFCRVPVRSLSDRHRARILMHLLALTVPDRFLRFGYAASDAQLAHYADTIDFSRDEVYGIFNRRLELVATAHLAVLPSSGAGQEAELGLSVLPRARGRGFGRRLFDRAVLHARNRRIGALVIHTLNENAAMLHIVMSAGAAVLREGGETIARLRLPPDDLLSHLDALVERQVADLDFRVKCRAMQGRSLQSANAGPNGIKFKVPAALE